VGSRVFVGCSDGNLYALSLKDGALLWKYEAGSPITAPPAVGEGVLVVGTEGGEVLCFGAKGAPGGK
jgi:outer membrane protein assembly factor BamB